MVAVSLGAGLDLRRWGGGGSDPLPAPVAPTLLQPPQIAGSGRIGEPVTLEPGLWSGSPEPVLTRQWLRDGAAIPGAAGSSYLPVAADDATSLAARVTATNAAGSAAAETAAVAVTYAPPAAVGVLPDRAFFQGSGAQTVAAAPAFSGEGLSFAASGAGATADPVTGLVSIPTAASVIAETVSVTATSSGGAAGREFAVTVIGAPVAGGGPGTWTEAAGDGLRTFDAAARFATAGDPAGTTVVYGLLAGAVTVEAGIFDGGVFVGSEDGYVSIDPATGVLGVDTDASGPLDGVTVVVRASNAAGHGDLPVSLTVAGAAAWSPAGLFAEAGAAGAFLDAGADPMFQEHDGTSGLTPADRGQDPVGTVVIATGSPAPPIYARAANGSTGRPTLWVSGGDMAIEFESANGQSMTSVPLGTFQAGWHLFVAGRRHSSSGTATKCPVMIGASSTLTTNYFAVGYRDDTNNARVLSRCSASGITQVSESAGANTMPVVGADFVMGGYLGIGSLKLWMNNSLIASGDSLFTGPESVANAVLYMGGAPLAQARPGLVYAALAYKPADRAEISAELRTSIHDYLKGKLPS